jgi:hypothetical protein
MPQSLVGEKYLASLVTEFMIKSLIYIRLLVFDDQQHVTGLLGTMIEGLRHMQNSTVNIGDNELYWFKPTE